MKKTNSIAPAVKVGLISLGCAKNLVDGEIMLGTLLKHGVEITNDAAGADVLIVNTCSFIDAAQEESVDTILESAELREVHHPGQGLIVSGCLPQRFREELPRLLPEVDAFMGIDQVTQVYDLVKQAMARRARKLAEAQGSKVEDRNSNRTSRLAILKAAHSETSRPSTTISTPTSPPLPALLEVTPRPAFIPDFATPRYRLTPRHSAYVKIAEGCNHPCTFCIIPRMRGSHRSRTQADIVAEARALVADGVREINLISQDSTYYGLDLRPQHSRAVSSPAKFSSAVRSLPAGATTLCTLLRELDALPGDFWIRLLYTHPAHWTDELIQTIADCRKVARYVDIPLQHIHENMLERMRRETSRQHIEDLIARIRAGIPGIALRTTFIVGFPGETDACFQSLLEFIQTTRFERLGVFTYSKEEGTRAGGMAGQVPDRIKLRRRRLAMAAQHNVARAISGGFAGRTLRVLVEGRAADEQLRQARIHSWEHGLIRQTQNSESKTRNSKLETQNYWVARGEADAPDIDGRVYIRLAESSASVAPGQFATVRIIGHTDYDLIAQALE